MPDTERTRQWLTLLARSDAVLVQLVGLAFAAVLAWELLRRLPEPWRGRGRQLYLAVGIGVLLTALRGQVSTPLLVVVAAVIGAGAVLGRALWDSLRRRTAGLVETKGQ